MNDSAALTLMVVEPDTRGARDDAEGLPDENVQLQSIPESLRFWKGKTTDVDLAKLKGKMKDVQSQINELLSDLKDSADGYRLTEVQVSLAINGSGSIGVATVGAEASIALTFAPRS